MSAVLAVTFGLIVGVRAEILLCDWQPLSRKLGGGGLLCHRSGRERSDSKQIRDLRVVAGRPRHACFKPLLVARQCQHRRVCARKHLITDGTLPRAE